jgi:hypothetical protein
MRFAIESAHKVPNMVSSDPLWRSPFGVNVYLSGTLPMLFALAVVLLLLACANLANLLLLRSVAGGANLPFACALGVSQSQSSRELRSEYPVFRCQILILREQFLVHRAGHIRQQPEPLSVSHRLSILLGRRHLEFFDHTGTRFRCFRFSETKNNALKAATTKTKIPALTAVVRLFDWKKITDPPITEQIGTSHGRLISA